LLRQDGLQICVLAGSTSSAVGEQVLSHSLRDSDEIVALVLAMGVLGGAADGSTMPSRDGSQGAGGGLGRTGQPLCAPDAGSVVCGDQICQKTLGESCVTCPGDCGTCPPDSGMDSSSPKCGNKVCENQAGESCAICPSDCCPDGGRRDGPTAAKCGDGVCDAKGGETCGTCPADCECPGECPCCYGVLRIRPSEQRTLSVPLVVPASCDESRTALEALGFSPRQLQTLPGCG
jgi:hypothetical protein